MQDHVRLEIPSACYVALPTKWFFHAENEAIAIDEQLIELLLCKAWLDDPTENDEANQESLCNGAFCDIYSVTGQFHEPCLLSVQASIPLFSSETALKYSCVSGVKPP